LLFRWRQEEEEEEEKEEDGYSTSLAK